jgi:CheY-like chemotaxis protein
LPGGPAASPSGGLALDDLARNVGHAINNPLGALILSIELALEALADARPDPLSVRVGEARRLLGDAVEAAQHIGTIVQELKTSASLSETREHASDRVPKSFAPGATTSSSAPAGVDARPRVLVVDDDHLVSRALARALGDCEVVVASDARDALGSIERGERYDVILCDLMMPDMTGMDLYEAMQEVAPGQVARMIFISGGAVTTRAREFAATVPNLLIEKPFDIQRLREVIRSRKHGR